MINNTFDLMFSNVLEKEFKKDISLKECLENTSEDILDLIKENITSDPIVKTDLDAKIILDFKDFLTAIDSEEEIFLDQCVKDGFISKKFYYLLIKGFLYGFKNKEGKVYYVLPKELKEIYLKEKMKITESYSLSEYLNFYLSINGIMPINVIEDFLINKYELKITKKEIRDFIKKNYIIYNNTYFYQEGMVVDECVDDLLHEINELENVDYYFASPFNLKENMDNEKILLEDVKKILHKKEIYAEEILILSKLAFNLGINTNFLKEDYNFSKSVITNLNSYFAIKGFYLNRLWFLKGWTNYEYQCDNLKRMLLSKKDSSLEEIFDNLDSDTLEFFANEYDTNKKSEIIAKITENFKNDFDSAKIIDMIMQMGTDDSLKYMAKGYIFTYLDNDRYEYYIPRDLGDIAVECIVFGALDKTVESLFPLYVDYNAIIEKKKLQELLKNNNDINLSIKEMDEMANLLDINIIDNKYYSFIEDFEKDNINEIMTIKNNYGKYKAFTSGKNIKEDFCNELFSLINEKTKLNNNAKDDIISSIIFAITFNMFNYEIVDIICNDNNIFDNKLISQIKEIIKKYRQDIPIALYNGFSLREISTKKVKIGRNELCPCGSGKKYKKCCGK